MNKVPDFLAKQDLQKRCQGTIWTTRGNKMEINDPPNTQNVDEFCCKMWETGKMYNERATWIKKQQEHNTYRMPKMENTNISETTAAIC